VVAAILLLVLPVFQMPGLLAAAPAAIPFYIAVAAYLAYVCYRTRPLVSWILMALMLLTHLAMWHLVYSDLKM